MLEVWLEKFSILELINNFSVSGDSKQKKKFPPTKNVSLTTAARGSGGVHDFVVRITQNNHFFDVAPYGGFYCFFWPLLLVQIENLNI